MTTQNQDFARGFLFSIAADFFIISKMLGFIDAHNKNFRCNHSMANIYKPLLESAGIEYHLWQEPFSSMSMFCSTADDEKEMDKFFEEVEDLCMTVNLGIRRELGIPMPAIYKNQKELDSDICNRYLTSIDNFCKNIPDEDAILEMPISNIDGKPEHRMFDLRGEV